MAIQDSWPNPKQNTAHEKLYLVLIALKEAMLQTGTCRHRLYWSICAASSQAVSGMGEAGRCLAATDRQTVMDGHGPSAHFAYARGKTDSSPETAISFFHWHSQAATEKGVRKIFVVLTSQWGGTKSLLQATMAPKALLKAASWTGALFPEELLYLDPWAPN